MAALGANTGTQIVVCDNAGGLFAARAWWMLRWCGHAAAAVLDGGMAAWQAQGGAVETAVPLPLPAGNFALRDSLGATVGHAELRAQLGSGERLIIDARAADRFRGQNETLDPVGGHIPGAVNRFFRSNLGTDGRFKPAAELRAEFLALLGDRALPSVVSQCGSGVTACHNLLAMEVAGLPGAALYPGSWSEWCAQPGAPIASGNAP
jgi:thiosulfate/3-mercaptopyruvate sulfurtransferase